ncbi:hypothetical protein ALC62_01097 [Cyphomyrmex costatus]|uniref:Uncharacterized protein n=1 Tax=Cyphomyrmex costatus TaxID=456900 RepID=A0A195D4T6_9HYME|nr:hypothetical protein ALC62_01097 [Cyphomyrmex costatus]
MLLAKRTELTRPLYSSSTCSLPKILIGLRYDNGASSKFQVDPDEAGCNEGSNLSVSLDPLPQFAEQRRLAGSSKFSGGQICMLWT